MEEEGFKAKGAKLEAGKGAKVRGFLGRRGSLSQAGCWIPRARQSGRSRRAAWGAASVRARVSGSCSRDSNWPALGAASGMRTPTQAWA